MNISKFHQLFSGRRVLALMMLTWMFILCGCMSGRYVQRINSQESMRHRTRSALTEKTASDHSMQVLRRYSLEHLYNKKPEEALEALVNTIKLDPNRKIAFAVSELSFLYASKSKLSKKTKYLLSAARYAYATLLDPTLGDEFSEYDPRFRLTANLYNRSLAQLVRQWRDANFLLKYVEEPLPIIDGTATIISDPSLKALSQQLAASDLAYDYKVKAFPNHKRQFGLGTPLILLKKTDETDTTNIGFQNITICGAALFASFSGAINDPETTITVKIFDPYKTKVIKESGHNVALELDYTVPLAYVLQTEERGGLAALHRSLQGNIMAKQRGLYIMQTYDPNKIPVVLVHGLMSSPMTWLTLFNELISDPDITDHYQFWFFCYPTGNPIVESAFSLRNDLAAARKKFNPNNDNKPYERMMIIGHSMGGILTRMMIQSSDGSAFPEMDIEKEKSRQLFQFEPIPSVKRVVFMATPHQGAIMAEKLIGKIGTSVISYSEDFFEDLTDLDLDSKTVPTGIDNLVPSSPFVERFNSLEMNPKIPFHSIIGNKKKDAVAGNSDGVVSYESSHLAGAESELIIKSKHNVHQKPPAILELKRILLLHLNEK